MCKVNRGKAIKMMGRGIFEEVEGLSIVSISDINFAYNTNMEGYTTLSSDIPKLSEIHL
ncbi:MAG: hypothetical protein H8D26_02970 [Methanomicrobia archaeon]|nr:hypothetical protein [Methanomicrobia archaeon]